MFVFYTSAFFSPLLLDSSTMEEQKPLHIHPSDLFLVLQNALNIPTFQVNLICVWWSRTHPVFLTKFHWWSTTHSTWGQLARATFTKASMFFVHSLQLIPLIQIN